jgi:phosphatidylserine/phosphatidylglycerophosphate/cardiolipin synthase-like enzyme
MNNTTTATPPPLQQFKGVGEYKDKINSDKISRTALCLAKIALNVLLGVAALGVVAVSIVFAPITSIVTVPLAIAAIGYAVQNIIKLAKEIKGLNQIAPSTHTLIPQEKEVKCAKLEEWDYTPMRCLPFEDCKKTFQFKKRLIENAEQEILISGSYCGRKAFDEVLDAIDIRMQEKPELRVHILTATRLVTDQDKFKSKNWQKIKELTKKYPDRFFTEFTFESFQANPNSSGFKYISNHAKLMIVDRKAMITGGSGIEDRWAYSTGLEPCKGYSDTGFVNASIAKTFRDKDFLIFPKKDDGEGTGNSVIERSALEFYKLFTRWHHFCETSKEDHPKLVKIREERTEKLGPFHNFYQDLLSDRKRINIGALVDEQEVRRGSACSRTKVFMSGPEQVENEMEKELVQMFEQAKNCIVINHMYFHPTIAIRKALKDAARRGVRIDILTNHITSDSPRSHKIFAPRSIFNARQIARAQKKNKDNVNLYYWDVASSTNHQKIIMIDAQYVLCGSSNLGYKGFNSMSDYEHNMLIDSTELSKQLQDDFCKDLQRAKKYESKKLRELPGAFELFATVVHHYLQPKIG